MGSELRRLRRPRYVLGLLAVGLYFWGFVFSRLPEERALSGNASIIAVGMLEFTLLMGGAGGMLAAWMSQRTRSILSLSEAEAYFLLGAPVTARQLLHLRLGRFLMRALLPSILWALFIGRRGGLHPALFGAGLGLGTFILGLHVAGASLLRAHLAERGLAVRWQRVFPWLAVSLVLGAAALSVWPLGLPAWGEDFVFLEALTWWDRARNAGVMPLLLAPVAWPLQLALAREASDAWWALAGSLGIVAVHYGWLRALERTWLSVALPSGEIQELTERGRSQSPNAGWTAWRLAGHGIPAAALLWKNLTASTRLRSGRMVVGLAALAVGGGAVILAAPHHERLAVAAVVLVVVAGFCTLVGPGALRIDLRMELEGLELLKALPLPGWQVIAAELAAPALLLFFIEWLLLGCALALGGFGESSWLPEPGLRRMILAGGALVLPTLTLAALTMHNAVAVLFPAWSRVEEGQGRGFEAFGQRLLTLLGTAVGVIGGGFPAAFVGLIAGALFWSFGDAAALAAGAIAGSLTMLVEIAVAVLLLGRAFDRMELGEEIQPA